jgi:hypothetical protein
MRPRKSLDIDPETAILEAKLEKLKADHKMMLGELVLETGIHKVLTPDQLTDALIRLRDQAKVSPPTRSPATREGKSAAAATFPARPDADASPHGQAEPEPARHRPPDLLAGMPAGRAGPRPAAEDTGLDRAS